jgi:preprotein translocase subunit SecD
VAPTATASPSPSPGPVYFRQVLCYAPPYNSAEHSSVRIAESECGTTSLLTVSNLDVTPSATASAGYTDNTIAPSPELAGAPSTKPRAERTGSYVLLPGLPGAGTQRYLLGPAQITSVGTIASASALKQAGQWVVNFTMTPKGRRLWDKSTQADFHRLIGMDLGGVVVSAPIIQPTQYDFTSFNGYGEIAGNLTKAEAHEIARAMTSSG